MKNIFLIISSVFIVFSQHSSAFSQSKNPGIKSPVSSTISMGRGNTGLGQNSFNQFSVKNIASWSNSNKTFYEFGISSTATNYTDKTNDFFLYNTAFNNVSWISSLVDSTLAAGFTFIPVTENQLSIKRLFPKSIAHRNTVLEIDGYRLETLNFSLNKFTAGISYKVTSDLNLGVGLNYYIANFVKEKKDTESRLLSSYKQLEREVSDGRAFGYELSALYNLNQNLSFGSYFSTASKILTEGKLKILTDFSPTKEINALERTYSLPTKFGIGAKYSTPKGNIYIDSEYETAKEYDNDFFSLSLGYESIPSKNIYDSFFEQSTLQFGAYYYNETFKYNNADILNYGITTGFSYPFFQNMNRFDMSLSYGIRGNLENHGISEKVIKFNVGLNISEYWYQRLLDE
jgi:hypothetical protein